MRRAACALGVLMGLAACGQAFTSGGGGAGGATTTSTGVGTGASDGGHATGAGPVGGAPTGAGANGANGGSGASGGTGGHGEGGALPSSGCPDDAPQTDAPCDPAGLECSYGAAMDLDCRTVFACRTSGFELIGLGDCLEAPLGCPETPPVGTGVTCAMASLDKACTYTDPVAYCWCTSQDCSGSSCAELSPPQWRCFGPPDVEACPATAPNLGTTCSQVGLLCDYLSGPCWAGQRLECTSQRIWQRVTNPYCIQ